MENQYRLKIFLPSGINYFYPLGIINLKEITKDGDAYCIENRIDIDGKVTFVGQEYTLFKDLDDSDRRCDFILAFIEQLESGVWHLRLKVSIIMKEMEFDLEKCQCSVGLHSQDNYALYELYKDEEVNFFDCGAPRCRVFTQYKPNNWFGDPDIGDNFPDDSLAENMWFDYGHKNGLYIFDVLTWLIKSRYGAINVKSDFFQWNSDDPGYTLAYNRNLTRLQISTRSDCLRWSDPLYSPATRMPSTMAELVESLCVLFNMKYRITEGEFRIEHVSWWDSPVVLDMTMGGIKEYLIGKGKWSYNYDDLYKIEKFISADNDKYQELIDAGRDPNNDTTSWWFFTLGHYNDFLGRDIVYDNECVNSLPGDLRTKTHTVPYFTNKGLTIRSYYNADSELDGCVISVGYESNEIGSPESQYTLEGILSLPAGQRQIHNELSWAQLHNAFHRHGRLFLKGNMNGVNETFYTAINTKIQKDIKVPMCDINLLPLYGKVVTQLGIGEIRKIEWDYKTQMGTLELAFPQNDYIPMSKPLLMPEGFATKKNVVFNSINPVTINDTGVVNVYEETKKTKAGGTVQIFSNGHYQYTPPLDYIGVDSFDYYGINIGGNNAFSSVRIGVRPTTLYVRGEIRKERSVASDNYHRYWVAFYEDAACEKPVDVTDMIIFIDIAGVNADFFLAKGREYAIGDMFIHEPFFPPYTDNSVDASAQYTVVPDVYLYYY